MEESLKSAPFLSKTNPNNFISIKRSQLSLLELKIPQSEHRMEESLKSEPFLSKTKQNNLITIKKQDLSLLELKIPQTLKKRIDLT